MCIRDSIYALVLFYFKELNDVPMSTSWVFLGLLAGRELGIALRIKEKSVKAKIKPILWDLGKVTFGLVISVALVVLINVLTGRPLFG